MSDDRIAVVTPAFDASAAQSDSFQRGLMRILALLDWAEVTVYTSATETDLRRADGGWAVRRFAVQPGKPPSWPQLLDALREGQHQLCLLSPLCSPLVRQAAQIDPERSVLLADFQAIPETPPEGLQEWLGRLSGIVFTSMSERRLAESSFGPLPNGRVLGIPLVQPPSRREEETPARSRACCSTSSQSILQAARKAGVRAFAARDPFQLSLREAWSEALPALVDKEALPACELCFEADGGIAFRGTKGFAEALRHLEEHPQTANTLGRQGHQFVCARGGPEGLAKAWRGFLDACRRRPGIRRLEAALFSPAFLPHDAVSNYMAETCRMFERWGAGFSLHIQDHVERDDFADRHRPVSDISPKTGLEIYNYPGWYPFMERLQNGRTQGTTVFDFHGVTPAALWPDRSLEPSHQGIRLARKADFVFVHSRFLERELIEEHGVDPARILRFPYSVDLTAFRPSPPDEGILQAYGLQGKTVLLYVGRMAPNKRIDVLVEGLARLPEECVLLLVGNIGFPLYAQEAEKARKLAERLGVAKRVVFTGSVSDAELRRIYSCADLMVSASLHEGFGIPFLEAMACAVPCVASDAAAIPEVIDQAGRTFRPADSSHFAQQAAKLLDDEQEYSRSSQAGLRQAQLYSRDAFQDGLLLALARILGLQRG